MAQHRHVVAAGAVVTRRTSRGGPPEVLLVHRPRYDDWSLPKGKLDRGEHATTAALREVAEETGLDVLLGVALTEQRYTVGSGRARRSKTVHYWTASVLGDDDVAGYRRADEIDEVVWMPWADALARLTYSRDRATVREAAVHQRRSDPLLVLRHADAHSRKAWRRDDRVRPLTASGERQAERLVPVLSAYGVERVVTSPSTRCTQTVAPYAATLARKVRNRDALSEEGATAAGVRDVVEEARDLGRPVVLCTHRPVLPLVYAALGSSEPRLEPAGLLVAHHRDGLVLACGPLDAPLGR
ncbi:NUDIX hydrolase [uncultured Nocardioides sp.]|uniref:NUDIX hydrolase n=1 Tax=uncultured Nocardioides sp. TaxID=198441 RepID=UPI002610CCA6|nr:NUDIX hydrolase [uncultured Nocardioides sp.]